MPIVTNPTAGDVHVNVPLTNFSQRFLQSTERFVGMRAFPNLPVQKQGDLYYEFDRSDFNREEDTERADGTESKGGSFKLSTDPYFCKVHAWHKDVTDRQRQNQDQQVRLDESATRYVTQILAIKRERLFATQFMAANIWFNGGTSASAGQNVDWSNASSTPIADVRNAKRGVQLATGGFVPNKMLIDKQGWDTLIDNDEILSRITGGANRDIPALVMRQLVAELLELDAIFVMDAVYNTGPRRNSATLNDGESNAFVAPNNALLYYAPDTMSLDEPTAAAQFSWTGLLGNTENGMRIKRFRMEHLEADRVEGQMAFDYRVTSPEMGHLFTSVSAA